MKFAADRPYADPKKVARKIVKIANSVEPGQEGRILHRADQRAVPVPRERHPGGIQSRPRFGDRARLAGAGPERNLFDSPRRGRRSVFLDSPF